MQSVSALMVFRPVLINSGKKLKCVRINPPLRCQFSTSSSLSAVRLSYAKYKPQRAASADHPVFVLHGLFGSKQNWHSLAKSFSSKLNQTIITVDARNHGESGHDSDHSYEAMCEDVEELMQELQISKGIFIGHSMGGKIAMCFSLRKPDLVDSLIVVDSAPATSPGRSTFERFFAAMKKIHSKPGENLPTLRKRALAELEPAIPDLITRQFIVTNLADHNGKIGWRINLKALSDNTENIMEFPVFHNFYGGPVLFIGGGNSNYITEVEMPEIKRLFPKAQVETIPDAGHWVHSEKPHELTEVIVNFLKNKEDHH
ncbi:protein ABHD11-like [Paramacrobiotus metropolitanus]|uniref:protein ABHD11-like n=1 Tax=Paramacrobiotus metropolitanus TaxID=2943436 RepID=UPI002445BF60|nr:protein ABHD11-like [Paramacrobiotus metropolitanus]